MKWYCKFKSRLGKYLAIAVTFALASCSESGYVTPPTQILNATLNTTAAEGHPRFSYDGRYLVFTSDRSSQRRVLLYDRQRNRLLSLAGLNQSGSMQSQADISADGRYIVYVSEQLGKPDIFVYDRLALNTKNITKNFVGEVRNPTISGNGRFVAFEGEHSGQWDIQIYDRGLSQGLSLPSNSPATESNSPPE
ncbi:PD40 domain-containing protein [Myxosarcina sp. GI1]|uniref:TolB family protein n=1 Tax=Myxosarcina sp. GI1 TaxID=1541065 RepID=UPI00056D7C47|nr:PD40 domain-containing protein [Myxosarcina sp. GI1]